MMSEITRWPGMSCMPRTPRAVRPMGRTSASRKRMAFPASLKSMTSRVPSVMAASTSSSPSRSSQAMMPLDRGREKSASGVFLTVPRAVAMRTYWPSA